MIGKSTDTKTRRLRPAHKKWPHKTATSGLVGIRGDLKITTLLQEFCEKEGMQRWFLSCSWAHFSQVFLGVVRETNEKVAIKWISKANGGGIEADLRHAEILHLVDHLHIISLKDYFDTPEALMLIMELVKNRIFFVGWN